MLSWTNPSGTYHLATGELGLWRLWQVEGSPKFWLEVSKQEKYVVEWLVRDKGLGITVAEAMEQEGKVW